MSDPIADRRQRAREAFHDGESDLDWAIEVATQVKITGDILRAIGKDDLVRPLSARTPEDIAEAVFRAAGFEVVE